MEVKIRIGASVDQSLRTAFRPRVQSAIEAKRQILGQFAQLPKEIAAGARAGAAAARDSAKERVKIEKDAAREIASMQKFFQADARRAQREMNAEHAASLRERRRREREDSTALARQRRADARELDRFATRTSHRTTRFLTPNIPIASVAMRAAHGLAAGLGVDTTFAGAARRNIGLEDAAIAFQKQARIAGQQVDHRDVMKKARGVQKRLGISAEDSVGGLTMFQKLAGDSKLGMDLFEGMADRSATANIGMEDVGAVLGNVSKALGDVPDKANRMLAVFDMLTAQGTKGAVEIEDMSKHIAGFTAPARLIEGDAGVNTMRLAALAQISRDVGGSKSASQSATAVGSLMNTFDKGARVKAFQDAGINMRNAKGELRDPVELIKAAIIHTKGDTVKMNAFVMDAQAKRAVRGFITEYQKAGGGGFGGAGDKAMDKLMENYMSGNIGDATKANMGLHLGKTSTQVAQFQGALDEVAAELQGQLLPVLREAQPHIIAFVKGMADLAAWVVKNPWQAVVAALAAAVMRAGIESVLRNAIERMVMKALAGGPVGPGGAGGTGNAAQGVGRLHAAQNVMAAAAFAALGVGAAVDQADDLKKVTGSKNSLADILPGMKDGKFSLSTIAEDLFSDAKLLLGAPQDFGKNAKNSGTVRRLGAFGNAVGGIFNMDENMNAAAKDRFAKEEADRKKKEAEAAKVSVTSGHAEGKVGETPEQFMERFTAEFSKAKEERELIEGQKAMAAALTASGGMRVHVVNAADIGGDGDDPKEDPKAPKAST